MLGGSPSVSSLLKNLFLRGIATRRFLGGVVVNAGGVQFHLSLFFGMAWGLQLMRSDAAGKI